LCKPETPKDTGSKECLLLGQAVAVKKRP